MYPGAPRPFQISKYTLNVIPVIGKCRPVGLPMLAVYCDNVTAISYKAMYSMFYFTVVADVNKNNNA